MSLTPQQSEYLDVIRTIERLGGSTSYEKHLSKSDDTSEIVLPKFTTSVPVFVKFTVKAFPGENRGKFATAHFTAGPEGTFRTDFGFWVNESVPVGVCNAGGMFSLNDWETFLHNPVHFGIKLPVHFSNPASVYFTYEKKLIGYMQLLGWTVGGGGSTGTCQWHEVVFVESQGAEHPALTMIKSVESMGGSEGYLKALTDRGETEIPKWSIDAVVKWPSTPCTVYTIDHYGKFLCTITDRTLHVAGQITTFYEVVPDTPKGKLYLKPGQKLAGLQTLWFVVPDETKTKYYINFYLHDPTDVIAVCEGSGKAEARHGRRDVAVWTAINY